MKKGPDKVIQPHLGSKCFLSVIKFAFLLMIISLPACGGNDNSSSKEGWTENQEIHFYNDCKDKMMGHGESEENAHAFCECSLLKLKDLYPNGKEAMKKLTDEEINKIERQCSLQDKASV